MLKGWEDYGKNWMHFVYKLDNLFRSIRVSDENSSVTKAFHFLKLISTPDFLCVNYAPFKVMPSIFNPFLLYLAFFMHLLIFLSYKTQKLKSTTNELWKGWKLAWYHHFTHIAYAKNMRGLQQKLDALRVQNWTISFEVSGFLTRTHLLHGHFLFLNSLQLQPFWRSVQTIQSDVINFQNFLTSLAIFQSFTDLFRELNDREIENHYKMNSENVETWHGIISSPT